jgi:hypothetical protein
MTALADARPPGLNILFRPGNTLTVDLTWATGTLTGRTFTSDLGGTALSVAINGDVMTIEASDAITGATAVGEPETWQLVETTGGVTEIVMQGAWTPSDDPAASTTAASVTVTTDNVDVAVTVASSQASIVALDSRLATAETNITALQVADTTQNGRLDVLEQARPFTEVPVGQFDNTVALTGSGGVGTVTATPVGGESGNDRRLYILDDLASGVADVEVHADLTLGAQTGIAFRQRPGVAVIVWSNIVFAANGNILQGVWEFNTAPPYDTLQTNQAATSLDGFRSPILYAVGDGATVTVKAAQAHNLVAGDTIHFDATLGAFGQVTVTSVPDANTFTFASTTAGTWSGGRWRWVIKGGRRKLAARLVGDRVTFKQWLPTEPEPSWADPDRAVSNLLPATLIGSGGPPPADGGVGLVVAHLGASGTVSVNDFAVHVLD